MIQDCRSCAHYYENFDKLCAIRECGPPLDVQCPDYKVQQVFVGSIEGQDDVFLNPESGKPSIWIENNWVLMGYAIAFGWSPEEENNLARKIQSARNFLLLCAASKFSIDDPGFWDGEDEED